MGYLSNFIVYMLAMVGVLMFALFLFKYSTGVKVTKNKTACGLKVVDTLSLNARKTLYVVEVDGERFLLAGDTDRTALISKLSSKHSKDSDIPVVFNEYQEKSDFGIRATQKSPYDSAIRTLASKARG